MNPVKRPTGVAVEETGHFFILGLLGNKEIRAYESCPTGVASVEAKSSFVNVLLSAVTVGLYTPRSYTINCGQ